MDKGTDRAKVTISGLLGGYAEQEFQTAFQAALENLDDPNTPEKGKRVVVLTVTLERAGDRSATCSVRCTTKLPARRAGVGFVQLGVEAATGKIGAREIHPQTELNVPAEAQPTTTLAITPAGEAANG